MSALAKAVRNSLDAALRQPSGARFYKCALQVNPDAYLVRYNKLITYSDESRYDQAIIKICKEENIEVIAVTDHYRIGDSRQLIKDAEAGGLIVFPGFEAVSKEGSTSCVFSIRKLILRISSGKLAIVEFTILPKCHRSENTMQAHSWSIVGSGKGFASRPTLQPTPEAS
jgi:hypothetical protein